MAGTAFVQRHKIPRPQQSDRGRNGRETYIFWDAPQGSWIKDRVFAAMDPRFKPIFFKCERGGQNEVWKRVGHLKWAEQHTALWAIAPVCSDAGPLQPLG